MHVTDTDTPCSGYKVRANSQPLSHLSDVSLQPFLVAGCYIAVIAMFTAAWSSTVWQFALTQASVYLVCGSNLPLTHTLRVCCKALRAVAFFQW